MASDVEDGPHFIRALINTSADMAHNLVSSHESEEEQTVIHDDISYYYLSGLSTSSGSQLMSNISYMSSSLMTNITTANHSLMMMTSDEAGGNKSEPTTLVEFMSMLRSQVLLEKIIYSILFIIGSIGNCFVLYNLFQPRFKSKMNYLIRHLAVADLMVVFLTIGTELIWRFTIKWETGELGCKIVQFWRIFPLYLTSLMMICITLDRFYAFVFPLTIFKSKERNFYFIISSYFISFVASIPQALIFHLESHPKIPEFTQCVTKGYFKDQKWMENLYNTGTLCLFYFIPLVFILVCYTMIINSIDSSSNKKQPKGPGMKEEQKRWVPRQVAKHFKVQKNVKEFEMKQIGKAGNISNSETSNRLHNSHPQEVEVSGTLSVSLSFRDPSRDGSIKNNNKNRDKKSDQKDDGNKNEGKQENGDGTCPERVSKGKNKNGIEILDPKEGSDGEESVKLNKMARTKSTNRNKDSLSDQHSLHSDKRTALMARAKKRTLRMSIAIVVTFMICWTPYSFIFLWELYDKNSSRTMIPLWLHDMLFIFAVTNSVVNPFIHSKHIFMDYVRRYRRARTSLRSSNQSQFNSIPQTVIETHV